LELAHELGLDARGYRPFDVDGNVVEDLRDGRAVEHVHATGARRAAVLAEFVVAEGVDELALVDRLAGLEPHGEADVEGVVVQHAAGAQAHQPRARHRLRRALGADLDPDGAPRRALAERLAADHEAGQRGRALAAADDRFRVAGLGILRDLQPVVAAGRSGAEVARWQVDLLADAARSRRMRVAHARIDGQCLGLLDRFG